MLCTPGFSLETFGPHGDKLLECANAYSFDDHHHYMAEIASLDNYLAQSGIEWTLTLQYGRVSDALPIFNGRLHALEKVVAIASSPSRSFEIGAALPNLMVCFHLHGQSHMVHKLTEILGFTFDSVGDYISELMKDNPTYTSMEHKGPGGGPVSLKRLLWQVKSFLVLHTDVPASKAIAWLEALPDDEGFYQYSMTMPTFDFGAFWGTNHQTCWIALAHEKVGLYDGALRFCRLALEPDLLKAGMPYRKWALTVASACKGRVLTKLNQHTEALAAFQAAITISKESYPMIEALAYRELANCCDVATADAPLMVVEAAAQAAQELEEKLKEFDGRLTSAEFDKLSIAPPLAPPDTP